MQSVFKGPFEKKVKLHIERSPSMKQPFVFISSTKYKFKWSTITQPAFISRPLYPLQVTVVRVKSVNPLFPNFVHFFQHNVTFWIMLYYTIPYCLHWGVVIPWLSMAEISWVCRKLTDVFALKSAKVVNVTTGVLHFGEGRSMKKSSRQKILCNLCLSKDIWRHWLLSFHTGLVS